MLQPLQAFLGDIVDYAGLFPPAQLALEPAIENYARYRAAPENWMLGRFIIPAVRLKELTPLGEKTFQGPAFRFSVLGRGGKGTQDFFGGIKEDLAEIARFREHFGECVEVDAYETKLPASAFAPVKQNQLSALIATAAYLIDTAGPPLLTPFFESPSTERASLLATIQAIHDDHHSTEAKSRRRCQPAGFKLRTGGLEASAFPPVEDVAIVLAACRAARVQFKATAGLHHPIRHFNAGVQSKMHGFVNVFGAGCLAFAHALSQAQIHDIIADENATNFALNADGLRWRDLRAPVESLLEARRSLVTSFGSCSFDEPRDDLRAIKWLP